MEDAIPILISLINFGLAFLTENLHSIKLAIQDRYVKWTSFEVIVLIIHLGAVRNQQLQCVILTLLASIVHW